MSRADAIAHGICTAGGCDLLLRGEATWKHVVGATLLIMVIASLLLDWVARYLRRHL